MKEIVHTPDNSFYGFLVAFKNQFMSYVKFKTLQTQDLKITHLSLFIFASILGFIHAIIPIIFYLCAYGQLKLVYCWIIPVYLLNIYVGAFLMVQLCSSKLFLTCCYKIAHCLVYIVWYFLVVNLLLPNLSTIQFYGLLITIMFMIFYLQVNMAEEFESVKDIRGVAKLNVAVVFIVAVMNMVIFSLNRIK